jgi:hypothetical protein
LIHATHAVIIAPLHAVIVALLGFPTGTDAGLLGALPVLLTRLLRLLGGTLWLHRNSLGLVGTGSLCRLFGECWN